MIALILAAGKGERLQPLTDEKPKCMVELAGRSLLDWQCRSLLAAGVDEIALVSGYKAYAIGSPIDQRFHNPEFASTNMVASLMCAKTLLCSGDDILICYGDIIAEPRVYRAAMECNANVAMPVNSKWLDLWNRRCDDPFSDAESLKIDEHCRLIDIGRPISTAAEADAQFMGITKLGGSVGAEWVRLYDQLCDGDGFEGESAANMYMTTFLRYVIKTGGEIQAVPVAGGWIEVDSAEELQLYEQLQSRGNLDEFCDLALCCGQSDEKRCAAD